MRTIHVGIHINVGIALLVQDSRLTTPNVTASCSSHPVRWHQRRGRSILRYSTAGRFRRAKVLFPRCPVPVPESRPTLCFEVSMSLSPILMTSGRTTLAHSGPSSTLPSPKISTMSPPSEISRLLSFRFSFFAPIFITPTRSNASPSYTTKCAIHSFSGFSK
jgi:hypothetical protein